MQAHNAPFATGRSSPQGFTAIEMLVVLAVIAIVILLIPPAIQTARERARRHQCRKNLCQYSIELTESRNHGVVSLQGPGATPPTPNVKASELDTKIFLHAAVLGIALSCALVAALVIASFVYCVDGDDFAGDPHSRTFLDVWFCPPSSSPI